MILDRLTHPIVLAPLAGGPSTPQLAAAVSDAGGLGFLGAGYLSAAALAERLTETRKLTSGPVGVNLFVPSVSATAPNSYAAYVERLREWAGERGLELGEPRFSDDEYEAKLELLRGSPPDVVSFTFGCPTPQVIQSLREVGAEAWVSVTTPEEAREAADAGAEALVVQGAEAGGHRASFEDRPDLPLYGLLALLTLVRDVVDLPLIASGGIATGAGVAAVICAGAGAAQLGSAFMLAPEAGTSQAHRRALAASGRTVLTRAFSGRLARGIHNRFIAEHDEHAPVAYPEINFLTSPMRAQAREDGDPDRINLWAGEAHQLAREEPAGEIVARLAAEAGEAMRTGALADRGYMLKRMPADAHMHELSREECLSMLSSHSFGRLAVNMGEGAPVIRPVNYLFDEPSQSVVFRTAAGSKFHALLQSAAAAFEIDGLDEATRTGWSVIIGGVTEEVANPTEVRRLDSLGLEPWAPGDRPHWLRIRARTVSGRRISLSAT